MHPTLELPHAGREDRHAASPECHAPRAATHEALLAGARDAWGRPHAGGPTRTRHALAPTRCRRTHTPSVPEPTRGARPPHAVHIPSHAVHVLPHAVRVPSHALRAGRHALPVFANALHVGAHAWCFTHHGETEAPHTPRAHRHAGALGLPSELGSDAPLVAIILSPAPGLEERKRQREGSSVAQ
jgi:hypothetical protein